MIAALLICGALFLGMAAAQDVLPPNPLVHPARYRSMERTTRLMVIVALVLAFWAGRIW